MLRLQSHSIAPGFSHGCQDLRQVIMIACYSLYQLSLLHSPECHLCFGFATELCLQRQFLSREGWRQASLQGTAHAGGRRHRMHRSGKPCVTLTRSSGSPSPKEWEGPGIGDVAQEAQEGWEVHGDAVWHRRPREDGKGCCVILMRSEEGQED